MKTVHDTIRSHRAPTPPGRRDSLLALAGAGLAALIALALTPSVASSAGEQATVWGAGSQSFYTELYCDPQASSSDRSFAVAQLRRAWKVLDPGEPFAAPVCPSPSPSGSPSPSPTVSPTGTPTPSSTASPTTPPSTAPPTTVPPTTTPPAPSPTVTPSPTPTGGPQVNCMPQPSRCGYPDATNTGVPSPIVLTRHNGDLVITQPGTYERLDVRGCVDIRANNVTLRYLRIGADRDCPWYVVRSFGRSGVLIEDTEIMLTGWETKGIAFDGYTARRVHFWGGSDCAHMGNNVTIVDSFCDIPAGGPADGPHYDGFQSDGGSDINLIHNTIRVPYGQTSAILMSTNTSPIYRVVITRSLFGGGGYVVYCGTGAGGLVRDRIEFTNNRISRVYFAQGGYWGPHTMCEQASPHTGNVWDDTGSPIGGL